jgi:hypothetical protein
MPACEGPTLLSSLPVCEFRDTCRFDTVRKPFAAYAAAPGGWVGDKRPAGAGASWG